MYKCTEEKGNKLDIDSDCGEIIVTVYSKDMGCEIAICMSYEESQKFKKDVAGL